MIGDEQIAQVLAIVEKLIGVIVEGNARDSVPEQVVFDFMAEVRRLVPYGLWSLLWLCSEDDFPLYLVTLQTPSFLRKEKHMIGEQELTYILRMRQGLARYNRKGALSVAWFEKATKYLHWIERHYMS